MKVGDLVYFRDKYHLVVKENTYIWSLQEVGSNWPPSIMDKGSVKMYIESGQFRIISKSLNKE